MSNIDTEIIKYYHERTKHKPNKFALSPGYLDWQNEPKPFRRYLGTEKINLPLIEPENSPPFYEILFRTSELKPAPFNIETVSKLLLFSLGISAWKEYRGVRWALRCNPSAGNLHPTEAYLITPPNLLNNNKATLYHYVADEHILEVRAIDNSSNWGKFCTGNISNEFIIIGLTTIIWRMAWKYGERALRYCLLDTGHAISSITYSAMTMGWSTTALLEINWHQLETILGLNREEFDKVEKETPQVFLLIHPHNSQVNKNIRFDLSIQLFNTWYGTPEKLSHKTIDWEIINHTTNTLKELSKKFSSKFCHQKNIEIKESDQWCTPKLISDSPPSYVLFRQRRSAHELDPKVNLPLNKFDVILKNLRFAKEEVIRKTLGVNLPTMIIIFINSVDELNEGIYLFPLDSFLQISKNEFPSIKTPNGETIYLYRKGNFRKFANYILCGQDVGGNSIALFGIFTDLQKAIKEYGEFTYILLHWEAGFLVHHLYLEAEILGLQGTGIGCFFDDEFNIEFSPSGNDIQLIPIYYYALGKPIPDTRLKNYPPYPSQSSP